MARQGRSKVDSATAAAIFLVVFLVIALPLLIGLGNDLGTQLPAFGALGVALFLFWRGIAPIIRFGFRLVAMVSWILVLPFAKLLSIRGKPRLLELANAGLRRRYWQVTARASTVEKRVKSEPPLLTPATRAQRRYPFNPDNSFIAWVAVIPAEPSGYWIGFTGPTFLGTPGYPPRGLGVAGGSRCLIDNAEAAASYAILQAANRLIPGPLVRNAFILASVPSAIPPQPHEWKAERSEFEIAHWSEAATPSSGCVEHVLGFTRTFVIEIPTEENPIATRMIAEAKAPDRPAPTDLGEGPLLTRSHLTFNQKRGVANQAAVTAALKRINRFAQDRGLRPGEPLSRPPLIDPREVRMNWALPKRKGIAYWEAAATVKRILLELGVGIVQNNSNFGDVGGMDELKARVDKSFGVQVRNPHEAAALNVESAALLLTGEPGNGKSHFAKCVAGEYGYNNFITIDSGVISTEGLQGKSEQKIRSVFELAKAISAMDCKVCVLFDEADSLIPSRDDATGSTQTRGNVNTFLTGLTSVNEDPNVLIILCSNYLDQLDPAAIRSGRVKMRYEVGYPDAVARAAIFKTKLGALPADVATVSAPIDLDHLAALTSGMTGSDVTALVNAAKEAAILRYENEGGVEDGAILCITQTDLEGAIQSRRGALKVTLDGDYSWDDLILPTHIVDELKMVVEQLTHAKEWEEKEHLRPLRGGILYGPPGTGKTQIARTLASNCSTPEAPCSFILADASAINSKWIGDGAKNLTAKFKEAAKNAPCILVFDEVQALIPDQSSGTAVSSETELDSYGLPPAIGWCEVCERGIHSRHHKQPREVRSREHTRGTLGRPQAGDTAP